MSLITTQVEQFPHVRDEAGAISPVSHPRAHPGVPLINP